MNLIHRNQRARRARLAAHALSQHQRSAVREAVRVELPRATKKSLQDCLGPELVTQVRAGFVLKGTTLGRWCREQGLMPQHARLCLLGGWNGPKGKKLRARLLAEAGLAPAPAPEPKPAAKRRKAAA